MLQHLCFLKMDDNAPDTSDSNSNSWMPSGSDLLVICIIFAIIMLILWAFHRWLTGKGTVIPDKDLKTWQWFIEPVRANECMGFESDDAKALTNQVNPLKDSDNPESTFQFVDAKKNITKGLKVAVLGQNDKSKANALECCKYASSLGNAGAAVWDKDNNFCYLFGYADLAATNPSGEPPQVQNQFSQELLNQSKRVSGLPGSQRFTYMLPCGGQGNIPCDWTGSSKFMPETNDFSTAGCRKDAKINGINVELKQTPRQDTLAFGYDHPICEGAAYIYNFGYWPKAVKTKGGPSGPPFPAGWRNNMPRFNPGDVWQDYNPNTLPTMNAIYAMDRQMA